MRYMTIETGVMVPADDSTEDEDKYVEASKYIDLKGRFDRTQTAHVESLRQHQEAMDAMRQRAEAAERERDALKEFSEFCDYHHRSCKGLLGQHLDCDCGYSEARDKLRAALRPDEPKGE